MNPLAEASFNPWSTDESGAGVRNALLLGEKTGHVFKQDEDTQLASKLEEMQSIKMIKLQKKISQHNERLNSVNFDIQKRLISNETKDITDIKSIEAKTKILKDMSDHLQAIISHKEDFITRLQQPFTGDHIKLEADFHKHASELFNQMAPMLSELTAYLDDLIWINNSNFTKHQLDELVSDVSGALASIQTKFQLITRMSHCISNLHSRDVSCNSSVLSSFLS